MTPKKRTTKKTTAKKTAAKKTTAENAPAKKATAKKTTGEKAPAKKGAAEKTTAKKAATEKTASTKATTSAKRTAAPTPGSDTPKQPPRGKAPTLGNPGADPQRIHREYVEQHTGGGEEPTPEAYERGLEQWHRLPGAVNQPPAEVLVRDDGGYPGDGPADADAEQTNLDDKEGDEEGSPS